MKLKIIVRVFLIVFLVSCNQANDSITISPTTAILPTKTETPLATLTSTPVPTSFPPLGGKPPYLVMRHNYVSPQLFIYDNDGSGRKIIDLPQNGWMRVSGKLSKIISPDGNWLAYYEGTVLGHGDPDDLPVSLHILNIKDGSTKKVADVVTEGYLAKLNEVAEQLKKVEPDYYKPLDNRDWVAGSVASEFGWSLYSIAWSPNGRYLAFAGQIEGISSDVYVYDLETESVQRVEDTLQNVQWITWSPDGSYLIFANSHPGYVYTGSSVYSISISEYMTQNPRLLISGTWLYIGDWLSPSKLLAAQGTDTAGLFDMQTVDVTTGGIKYLWEDGFGGFVIDYETQTILFTASESAEPENFGIYEVSFSGERKKVLNGLYFASFFFRGGEKHRFLLTGSDYEGEIILDGDVVGLTKNNEPTYLGKFDYQHIKISPDKSWLLMYDEEKAYLYDKNDELKNVFMISNIYSILWRPDSMGFYYSADKSLFYLDINNRSIRLIDQCFEEVCGFVLDNGNSAWLP